MNLNLSHLTVVVPSYNRQDYICRLATYYTGTSLNILVLDGSDEEIALDKKNIFPANFKYIYLNKDFLNRLKLASEMVDTPYVCLLGDDEFLFPETLLNCIDFLSRNEDFVCCSGLYINFRYNHSNHKIVGKKTLSDDYINHQFAQESLGERLKKHFSNYQATTVYSVIKKSIWKNALQAFTFSTSCTYSPEISFEAVVSSAGKTKILNELYSLRSSENNPISNKKWNRKLRFNQWYVDNNYADEIKEWSKTVSKVISVTTNTPVEKIQQLLAESINSYIQSLNIPTEVKYSYNQIKIRKMVQVIKKIIRSIIPAKTKDPFSSYEQIQNVIKDLAESGVKIPRKDVDRALNVINDFHTL